MKWLLGSIFWLFGLLIGVFSRFTRKVLKIYPQTTVGDLEAKLKAMNKNDIIYHIVMTAATMNGTQPCLTPGYKKELRGYGKRQLIKTAVIMHVALSKKLKGEKIPYDLTGMKGMKS